VNEHHISDGGAFELTEDLDRARAIATGERAKYLADGFSETLAEQKAHEASSYAMGQFVMERQRGFVTASIERIELGTRKPVAWRIANAIMVAVFGAFMLGNIAAQDWVGLGMVSLIGIAVLLTSKPNLLNRNGKVKV
jgi:hypothetical protein